MTTRLYRITIPKWQPGVYEDVIATSPGKAKAKEYLKLRRLMPRGMDYRDLRAKLVKEPANENL